MRRWTQLALAELPQRWGPLAFLFPTTGNPSLPERPRSSHPRGRRPARHLFNNLIGARRRPRPRPALHPANAWCALFAEDIGLLDKYFVAHLLDDCNTPDDSFDLIGGLFVAMNTPGKTAGGRFKGVDYFNGGLFAEPARIELARRRTRPAPQKPPTSTGPRCSPEIFGTLFEHSIGSTTSATPSAPTSPARSTS